MMRALILLLLCASAQAGGFKKLPMTEADAVRAIQSGQCGSMGLGNGLVNGIGWVHSPIPGPHEFRIAGGTVSSGGVTLRERVVRMDIEPGRPYYITVQSTEPGARVEWCVPGFECGPVPLGFLLPPSGNPYPRLHNLALQPRAR